MKAGFLSLVLFAVTVALPPAPASAADYAGSWDVAVRESGQRNFYLPMTDGRLVIETGGRSARFDKLAFTGRAEGDGLRLSCAAAAGPCGSLLLRLVGDRLTGGGTLRDSDGLERPVTLEGARPASRRPPRTFDYDPAAFQNFYSAFAAPVLRLQPGDSVHTRTLDSRGYDRDGRPRAPRGNPLTGPFFIDGAMPGDTLAVHLERVRTNRDSAYQSNLVAASALEAGYLREIGGEAGGFTRWKIDAAAGTASLVEPGARMRAYAVPLAPMLGCIGVAPPRGEVLGAGHLGAFGGNLDTPRMREGVTLYLPVFEPGALLFLGDGHARQGDGELPGQGLETSMDVTFRVDLIRGQSLGQPRLENDDAVTILGTGATLDAAMKNATTGMSRWLAATYGLTPHDIAPLLGTAMRYEIAEVVDSEYDVAAGISKAALASLGK